MNLKIGLCQTAVLNTLEENLSNAKKHIIKAVNLGAQLVVLPEMFQTPYENSYFVSRAEGKDLTYKFLKEMAKSYGIILVGGSYAYKLKEDIYNTCFIFDQKGEEIGHHSKMHLFDIDVPGGIRFMESDTLSPGTDVTVVETTFGKIGVSICYDMRFPELYRAMAMQGAEIIITPAAFNMTTGPAHWDILAKGRALDNQVFNVLCSPARDESGVYTAYGHSMVVSPWGQVLGELEVEEDVLLVDIPLKKVQEVRTAIPTYNHLKWSDYPKTFDYMIKALKKDLYYINASNRYIKRDCWMEQVGTGYVIRNNHWTLPLFEDEETLKTFVNDRTDNYIGFPGVKKEIYDYFKEHLILVWENEVGLFFYDGPRFDVSHNLEVNALTMADFDIIHGHYSYQSDISKSYISAIIEKNMTLCIRVDGKPVSWIVEHMDGSLGIIYTLEAYRKKGYGELLSKLMVNQFIEKDKLPYLHIETSNGPSNRLAKRLGFKHFDNVYWFGVVKEKNVSRKG